MFYSRCVGLLATVGNYDMDEQLEHLRCGVCGVPSLDRIPRFALLPRVTSDCVPFRDGGTLAICRECGAAQSPPSEQWSGEVREIYSDYSAYRQSGGVEQQVFDSTVGFLRPRSEVLLERFLRISKVPNRGKILDVGCGTGSTLKVFASVGEWSLYGLDLDEHCLPVLRDIPGFNALYTCAASELPERRFDIITLVHSLEHFATPCETLRDLHLKLKGCGWLLIQVPNAAANPFDYIVADHMMHFTPQTLAHLIQRAGFRVRCIATDWVAKEISLVAASASDDTPPAITAIGSQRYVIEQLNWLHNVVTAATMSAATTPSNTSFGVFGTSVAAAWLWPAISGRIQFFVEEDPSRIGRTYMGRPILSPTETPAGAVVFLALMPPMAAAIKTRLEALPIDFRMPPPLP
jgi:2-polyprenyl-3-methyl-5-hydroxy-6-metoxy-1,4-benzoquinol methylase